MSDIQSVLALPAPAPENRLARLLEADVPTTGAVYQSMVAGSLSERTKATYRAIYEEFGRRLSCPDGAVAMARLLGQNRGMANLIVSEYRDTLLKEGFAPNTVNQHVGAIRSLVKEAKRVGVVDWTLDVRGVKGEVFRDTKGPGHENIQRMLKSIVEQIESKGGLDPKGRRDLAILRLLYDCGLRRFEVAGLDLEHLDLPQSTLAVLGKGKRKRKDVHVPAPTLKALSDWLAFRGDDAGPLFRNLDCAGMNKANGRRLSKQAINKIVKQTGKALGIKVWPHAIRHSAVTSVLIRNSGNVAMAAAFARHVSWSTTKVYADNLENLAKQASSSIAE